MGTLRMAIVQNEDYSLSVRAQTTGLIEWVSSRLERLATRFTMASARRGSIVALTLCGLAVFWLPAAATGDTESPRELGKLRLQQVNQSVKKCLAALNAVGPNRKVDRILQRIANKRGHGDAGKDRFVTSDTLAELENATGGSIGLNEAELETCFGAFDMQVGLAARTATASATHASATQQNDQPPCGDGFSLCVGTTGSEICCNDQDSFCSQTCSGRGSCAPWCEEKWCFPAGATVRLEDGSVKAMRELALGDRVQVVKPDGSLGYEAIYLMTHKDPGTAGRYLKIALASGQTLSLSPRHFIPTAADTDSQWGSHVLKGADELKIGDVVWYQSGTGTMLPSKVTAMTASTEAGVFNPMTASGTIVVDGVVASAHSDWFLDGIASAEVQGRVYQAMFAPVRGLYRVIGPEWMQTVTERWGVVDFVREWTSPRLLPWVLLIVLVGVSGGAWAWRAKRRTERGVVSSALIQAHPAS